MLGGAAALAGCAGPPNPSTAAADDATAWLVRASLDLRGIRPSLDELDGDGSDLDPLLEVRDPNGRSCAGASSLARTAVGIVRGRSTVSVAFVPLVGGAYTCFVRDARGGSGPTYTYSLARH